MTDSEINKFLTENYKTMKNTELIAHCNIKPYLFYRKMKSLQLVKKPQTHWTVQEDVLLEKLWDKDLKSNILKAFPYRTYKSIKTRANDFGFQKDKSILFHNKLKMLLEESNTNCYWIGFLMADGHFSKTWDIKLTLAIKDLNHLEKFAKLIDTKIHIGKSVKYKQYTSQPNCNISVRDISTVKILKEKYSIDSNKTKNPCDISLFDTKEKFLSWFAGFFDGDGCVLKNKSGKIEGLRIQIYNTWIKNLEFISEKLKEYLNINSRSYIDSQGYARWVCFKDAGILIKEIQSLNLPIMERKLGLILN